MIDFTHILQFSRNPEVVSFITTYIATKGLDGLFDGIKSIYSKETLEYQLLTCLEKALSQTCSHFGWEYDSKAISETFLLHWENIKKIETMKSLSEIIEKAIGNQVSTEVLEYWGNSFYRTVAEPQNVHLYNYLILNRRVIFGNASKISALSQQYFVELYFFKSLFMEKDQLKGIKLSNVYVLPDYDMKWFVIADEGRDYSLIELITDFLSERFPLSNWVYTRQGSEFLQSDVMFIFGHPGIGKTSLAAHLIQTHEFKDVLTDNGNEKQLFTIRLREFNKVTERNPLTDILEYLNSLDNSINAMKVTLDDIRNSIFLLDGLDELCAIHGINGRHIKIYCDNLLNCIKDIGGKIIITSRMNVLDIDNYSANDAIVIHLKPFNSRHKRIWFDKYSLATGSVISNQLYDSILNENDSKKEEILGIPLILYMIASLNLDPAEMINLGNLYDRLFEELKNRHYNISGKTHAEIELLDETKKLARMYAKKMFEQRTFILDGVTAKDALQDFIQENEIDMSIMDLDEIERNYAISFYYSKIRANQLLTDKMAVEFVHRSIQEYLMADVIWGELCNIQEQQGKQELFEFIYSLFSKSKITREILDFLKYRLSNPINHKNPRECKNHLERVNLVGNYLKNNFSDFMKSNVFNSVRFADDEEFGNRTCNMFYSYWGLLRTFFVNCSPLNIDDSSLFSKYLKRLSKLEDNMIDLSYVTLINADLSDSNLEKACFDKSFLINVNFSNANLANCSFKEAELYRCEFIDGCMLHNVNFYKTRLVCTNLMYSVGRSIIFENTSFLSCAINEADFWEIDWRQTPMKSIRNVSFSLCHIPDLISSGVNLSNLEFYDENFDLISAEVIQEEMGKYNKD